ncbi:MAG: cell division ATP-binding protein FtsE [Acidaminococcaceae bacterium]|nr:cell division ATP-binding protein FtsE [Acidaminococcaceae bacterium]MDO4935897.1 cell division ATP-binding protein FtsE [Phascolarctobacterium sp.]
MVNVCKTYNGQEYALYNVNLHIKPKEFVFLVGPSGAGKSTFIKLLFKEINPESGDIFVNGININELEHDDIPDLRRLLGIVFQDYRLLPDRTVYENVAFAMRVIEAPSSIIRRRVMHVLDLVGLREKANSKTTELSGGEQQRVAIARAVVNDPKILIADEPTGNLDPETKWDIMRIFQQINDSGATIIMATHDEDIVNNLNKRVIGIDRGRVVRDQKRGGYDYQY